jgi:xylan 1,4-beta-xylosidase
MPVEGSHDTVDAWFVRGDQSATLILTNFALPRHPIETEQVCFSFKSAKPKTKTSIRRIDLDHANAKHHWEQLGKPGYLSGAAVDELKASSQLRSDPVAVKCDAGVLSLEVPMPPQSVAAIRFSY